MVGVGLAEQAGLMTALIKKIMQVMPRNAVTWISDPRRSVEHRLR
jgi:p-aminobenzoyl-glutamate transporter AbgT